MEPSTRLLLYQLCGLAFFNIQVQCQYQIISSNNLPAYSEPLLTNNVLTVASSNIVLPEILYQQAPTPVVSCVQSVPSPSYQVINPTPQSYQVLNQILTPNVQEILVNPTPQSFQVISPFVTSNVQEILVNPTPQSYQILSPVATPTVQEIVVNPCAQSYQVISPVATSNVPEILLNPSPTVISTVYSSNNNFNTPPVILSEPSPIPVYTQVAEQTLPSFQGASYGEIETDFITEISNVEVAEIAYVQNEVIPPYNIEINLPFLTQFLPSAEPAYIDPFYPIYPIDPFPSQIAPIVVQDNSNSNNVFTSLLLGILLTQGGCNSFNNNCGCNNNFGCNNNCGCNNYCGCSNNCGCNNCCGCGVFPVPYPIPIPTNNLCLGDGLGFCGCY